MMVIGGTGRFLIYVCFMIFELYGGFLKWAYHQTSILAFSSILKLEPHDFGGFPVFRHTLSDRDVHRLDSIALLHQPLPSENPAVAGASGRHLSTLQRRPEVVESKPTCLTA